MAVSDCFSRTLQKCMNLQVKKSELQIWSLRIPARNCVLAFLKHDQSTQYG
jgi:hypothetical protein